MEQASKLPARVETAPASRALTARSWTGRQVALVVHRYVGLAMALFLVVAGLTGSLLAFYHEADALLSPSLFHPPAPAPNARPLDPFELLERMHEQTGLPRGAHATWIPLTIKPGHASIVYVSVPEDATGWRDDELFFDPYTGALLGSRRWGELTQGTKNLIPFVYRLHYSLALDDVGTTLFGIVALLWTIDCFVGAYLTLPTRSRERRTTKSWLARWKPAWLVKASSTFALVFTWHRASGLWVWAMLFVFAWSAVGLNLNDVYHPVMRTLFGMTPHPSTTLPTLDSPRPEPRLSWREARETARERMAEEARARGFEVLEENEISYDPSRGTYRYRVRSSRDISDRRAATSVWIDGDSGRLLAFDAPTGENVGNTVSSWLYQLHFGSIAIGGLPYRIFVSLMGLAVAALSITGVWIWWRKRSKRSEAGARTSSDPA